MNLLFRLIEYLYLKFKNNKVYYDILTGTRSRYYYDTVLRSKYSGKSIIIVYVDIDNLKHINDRLGHYVGTEYIKVVSNSLLLLDNVLEICRIGGDEFLLVFDSEYDMEKIKIPSCCSYGISKKELWEDLSSAVSKADKSMYAMKKEHHRHESIYKLH